MVMSKPRLGNWGPTPGWGSMIESFDKWTGLCPNTTLFRSRGGEGQLDNEFVLKDSETAMSLGYLPSLQIQPKTGSGSNRKGIPYKDISDGNHDTVIIKGLEEIKAATPDKGVRIPFELHSEFNIQSSGAQPYVGPPEDYAGFVKKVHDLAKQVGVRRRLKFIASATRGVWSSSEWHRWLDGCIDQIDCLAVDGYSQPKTGQPKEFEYLVLPIIDCAIESGKQWAVMETGCQEKPNDVDYKLGWYDRTGGFLETYLNTPSMPRCMYVVFNTSNDGSGGWQPTSSDKAYSAFIALCNRDIWKGGV